jgi:hypothetical protein
MRRRDILTEPEVLTRKDTEGGRWTIDRVPAKRGLPSTNIPDRHMEVPADDSEMSRCIRAHEMMHAKVSPSDQLADWVERGVASRDALVACEELRVNLLCQKAGFDMKTHLSDDGETADGERIAALGDWESAVRMTIACAGTASEKKFLTGIRRHNRRWGKVLKTVADRAVAQMESAYRSGWLANTGVHEDTGLAPMGFFHTEALGEWVDRIAGMTPPEEPAEEPEKPSEDSEKPSEDAEKAEKARKAERDAERWEERVKGTRDPRRADPDRPVWVPLKMETCVLSEYVSGSLGRKRSAAQTGRYPRRLHRMMTDPERRIFDSVKKADGGIVVIDCSGSMSLSHAEVKQMMEVSPGCTIVAYSHRHGQPNAYIIAKDGRMTKDLPDLGGGNCVDGPVLDWAIKNRKNSRSPIVWVCDGIVTGTHDQADPSLDAYCKKLVDRHGIICAYDVPEGIEVMRQLARGQKPRSSERTLRNLR